MINNPVNSLEILSKKLDQIEKSTNEGYSRLSDYVGKSIDTQALILAAVGIIGILVSIYVQKSVDKATKAKDEANTALDEAKKVRDQILNLFNRLDNEPEKVYTIIRNQQMDAIFDRLEKTPEDIHNTDFTLAFSTFLDKRYFKRLKSLFLRCNLSDDPFRLTAFRKYIIVLVYHFPEDSISDFEIRRYIESEFPIILQSFFTVDLLGLLDTIKKFYQNDTVIRSFYVNVVSQIANSDRINNKDIKGKIREIPNEVFDLIEDGLKNVIRS